MSMHNRKLGETGCGSRIGSESGKTLLGKLLGPSRNGPSTSSEIDPYRPGVASRNRSSRLNDLFRPGRDQAQVLLDGFLRRVGISTVIPLQSDAWNGSGLSVA